MKKSNVFCLIALLFLFESCATILGGSRDVSRVNQGTPKNARVYLNGEYIGEAPQKVKVQKNAKQGNSYIEIKADGYETARINLTRKMSVGYFLLDLPLFVPLCIDLLTGNIYKPRPNRIDYYLEKKDYYNSYSP